MAPMLDKAFADALGQSYTKSYPFSQLDHFTYTLLWRLAHLDKDARDPPSLEATVTRPSTPRSFLRSIPTAGFRSQQPGLSLAIGVATAGAGVILSTASGSTRDPAKPLILPVSTRAERLGAPPLWWLWARRSRSATRPQKYLPKLKEFCILGASCSL